MNQIFYPCLQWSCFRSENVLSASIMCDFALAWFDMVSDVTFLALCWTSQIAQCVLFLHSKGMQKNSQTGPFGNPVIKSFRNRADTAGGPLCCDCAVKETRSLGLASQSKCQPFIVLNEIDDKQLSAMWRTLVFWGATNNTKHHTNSFANHWTKPSSPGAFPVVHWRCVNR